ncbi:aminopeptidase P family protein [Candidatus Bathyarchaeota archaeon]|nr:aminopeptidase P family protein [Candidatus Bathyarchaeota archaeon]
MRIELLKNEMIKSNIDGYLISNINNVFYFTGFMDISDATLSLIIPLDGEPTLLVPPLSYAAAKHNASNCLVDVISNEEEKIVDKLINNIKLNNLQNIEFDTLPIPMYMDLIKKLNEVKMTPNRKPIWNLRRIKDAQEISFLRKASLITDIGVEAGIQAIKAGVKEYEIAAEAEYAMRLHGSEGIAFDTIVASGPRSAYPHGVCTNRVISKGDFVILDLGAISSGYRSDITRTVVVGTPTQKQNKMLELVSRAHRKALECIHENIIAHEVDANAREILKSGGYGKEFLHGLGHGVGLDIHEPPTLSSRSEDILKEGNVVTVEPGIYILGFGGIRIEDTVLVHKNCGEQLTQAEYYL